MNPRSAIWNFVLPLSFKLCALSFAAAASGERKVWQYTQGEETVRIVNTQAKEWAADRADGRKVVYEELARTEDFVELRNVATKLRVRLHADHGEWRRESDADWKRWMNGAWVSGPPKPPAAPAVADAKPAATPATGASPYRVRVAYFVPKDRQPAANYEQKIAVVMSIVSEVYRTDLQAKGYQTDGLSLESANGKLAVRLVRGEKAASYYNDAPKHNANEHWRRLLPEIRSSVGDTDKHVIVVFAETYDFGPWPYLWPGVMARGAYYSAEGGLAIYTAHILRDEFCALSVAEQRRRFVDTTPMTGRRALGHGPNSPRGEFAEDGFGAVAHELGHALGLPHDRRDDSHDIMGNGFRNLRWNFPVSGSPPRRAEFSVECARLLMSSRYLARDLNLADNQPPTVELKLSGARGTAPSASVKASDNTGLRAVVFVDETAGTVVAGRKLSSKGQDFRESLPTSVVHAGQIKVRAIVTDDGGHQTRVSETLRVGGAGK